MHIETWNMYFPEEEFTAFNELVQIILAVKKKLKDVLSEDKLERILEARVYYISEQYLESLVEKNLLDTNAGNLLLCVSCAVSELLYDKGYLSVKICTRVETVNKEGNFGDVDRANLGKLVFMAGTVCRVGFRRVIISKMFFECSKCGDVIYVNVKNNVYRPPAGCKGSCNSRSFVLMRNHPEMECRDMQEIKIQELYGGIGEDGKGIPKAVDCILYDEFVGILVPGDIVQIVGVLGVELENDGLYRLMVHINNLQIVKNKNFFIESLEYQSRDFAEFRRIAKGKNTLASLVRSLYSSVYGNELIKIGLVLSLFGGTRKMAGQHLIRSETHVLIIGDPGLGKSRLLLGTCSILPKSSYVSGSFTTTAGLTVSLTHDPVSGEYMADAGALVVADNGICCLDEFDKIDDHAALFEAMEDQKVSIAKGGVICSVPTRSTVIAATNPRHGHFDRTKSMMENIRFDPGLLSRFDLVFLLLDDLSEKESYMISGQILKKRQTLSPGIGSEFDDIMETIRRDDFIEEVRSRGDVYPMEIMRKYISYARANVFPVLSKSAKEAIREYYVEIRKQGGVSARDLESLIRLTEARAKAELRSIATRADAVFCIELHRRTFVPREKMSNSRRNGDFSQVLKEYGRKKGEWVVSVEELRRLIISFDSGKPANDFIEALNHNGLIIKKGAGMYKITR
ncbi:DNA replication licensing factor Mcm4 [Encephalitozoon intestinalis ATCC 50506]|uniref:DNA helicase n=1 Tax=Encephalitozoon intestinalis (strain ATCC 50506) TaxID=876142 RepID=E0SAE2_ENCIT|nr:DNA replication licensing factor Mcm4 [Encephalitozoon intestinalis ATCC 50506]ADM12567.1 DNA replication licensing factor Mcm4 [Encephalitozoon intestinalis ATCC 50506]UTX46423.1 cell division control protein 21 [Encephalitozoon intestinalis]